jgi:hypothetical protein
MNEMKNRLACLCVVLSTFVCHGASANIEPSSYDAKSIGAGTTGMAYLDNPSALAVFGAKYSNVTDLHGQPGATGDFEVRFVSGEAAVRAAFEILRSLYLDGSSPLLPETAEIPFYWQNADDEE